MRVKAGLKGPTGRPRKECGRVGVVRPDHLSLIVEFGAGVGQRASFQPEELEPYTADPIVEKRVRVLNPDSAYRWQEGTVTACTADGWQLTSKEIASIIDPVRECFTQIRAGTATEVHATVMHSTIHVAQEIERGGIVHGLAEHFNSVQADAKPTLHAAALAAPGIPAPCTYTSWTPSPPRLTCMSFSCSS
ncbi:hypothetical protein [Delftia acidovorans]|uniref:hypothetical protein n=1 Tax=Delftia acidovorans TaxID=80866 RepID=UPI0028A5AF5F|nr:hypothetical protein [Delftia acidovorans]